MTKLLELPEDLAARIAAEPISDDALIRALRQNLEQKALTRPSSLNAVAKAEAFRAWVASHKDITAVILDDSREALYAHEGTS